MFCSDSPPCCELRQKTVQERRKDGGEDQSQDPNGFGVYLWRAGNNYEAGKSDNTRHGTDSESNKHADDNLFHDFPFSACDLPEAPTALLICVAPISTFLQSKTHLPATLFQECTSQLTPRTSGLGLPLKRQLHPLWNTGPRHESPVHSK